MCKCNGRCFGKYVYLCEMVLFKLRVYAFVYACTTI